MKIDKSIFSAEELAQYEALIAKAKVEETEAELTEETPPPAQVEVETQKSASPELEAALQRMEALEKSIEMKGFSEIAKKYAPLGEKEEELAKTLYDMKKSNQANYDAYISVLDKSLALVEKSGIFAEIGKSAGGHTSGGVESKVEAKAADIMKADPSIDYTTAIAKAWEDPTLMAEYDAEYRK